MRGCSSHGGSLSARLAARLLSATVSVRASSSATTNNEIISNVVEIAKKEEKPPRPQATPETAYRPPDYARKMRQFKKHHWTNEEFHNAGIMTGSGARLHDYFEIGKLAARMPTIKERIDFVSPYERDWARYEKTWRREHHPQLASPRKAWQLGEIPLYHDPLDFYKYITKTRLEERQLDDFHFYKDLRLPTEHLEEVLGHDTSFWESAFIGDEQKVRETFLSVFDGALDTGANHQKRMADFRVSYDVPIDSFWIRAGFTFLYDTEDIQTGEVSKDYKYLPKYTGDDRRKLGELAFCLRDRMWAQLRVAEPSPALFPFTDEQATLPVFDDKINVERDVLYSPKVINLKPDREPLWQRPGYFVESEETHKHVHFQLKSILPLRLRYNDYNRKYLDGFELSNAQHFQTPSYLLPEYVNMVKAQAVATLFGTLCAEAHTHGFTQYNEITRPFVSQLMLTDGLAAYFAVGQLNTLAINIECEGFSNPRTNVVYFEGPIPLIEKNGEFSKKAVEASQELLFYPKLILSGQAKPNPLPLLKMLQMISWKGQV